MKKLQECFKKLKNIRFYKFILLLCLFIFWLGFFIWHFGDIKITQWGDIPLTTSNFLESYYWTKKIIFWDKTLELIEEKVNEENLKKLLLEAYVEAIPVNQWWSPLRGDKVKALRDLFDFYRENEDCLVLEKAAFEFIKINSDHPDGYFNLGLALEKQGKLNQAAENYRRTLSLEKTHLAAIKQLSSILIEKDRYYEAKEVISAYETRVDLVDRTFCFYSDDDNFAEGGKSCGSRFLDGKYVIRIDNKNVNIKMIRIDPPQGKLFLQKIEFVSPGGKVEKTIDSFRGWIMSKDLKKVDDHNFYSIGSDPYLYIKLSTHLDFSQFDQVLIEASIDPDTDPEIDVLLKEIEDKIS